MSISGTLRSIVNYFGNVFNMLKRRTSKRFVLGDNDEPNSFEDNSTEVIPSKEIQKFQMTLHTDQEENENEEPGTKEEREERPDNRLLRPPNTGTLQ